MSNYETQRAYFRNQDQVLSRFGSPGPAVMVGAVVTPASRITVGGFFLVNPVNVTGAESEGAAGTTAVNTAVTVPVYLIGPGIPQAGEMVVCRFVDFRWVAERKGATANGSQTHVLVGCPCAKIPAVLNVLVAQPDYSPFGYPYIRPDVLTWQPPPVDCPRAVAGGYTGYWGSQAFQYYGIRSVNPYVFRYFLRCVHGYYVLSYWYTKDSVVSADTGFYDVFDWVAGFPGNQCLPFKLTNGVNVSDSSDRNSGRVQIIGG